MPYVKRKRGSKWCVYKKEGGRSMGCHDSPGKADRQIRALYAKEGQSSAGGSTVTIMDTNGDKYETFFTIPSMTFTTGNANPVDWQNYGPMWEGTNATWTMPLISFQIAKEEEAVDEEEERGERFEGVLAVIGHVTSDNRYLIPEEVFNRDLPLPFMVQTQTQPHHLTAENCGRIESITHIPVGEFDRRDEFGLADVPDDAVVVWGEGTFDLSEHGEEAERMIENGAGVSIDMPPDRVALFDPETLEEVPEEEIDFEAALMGAYVTGIAGKIAAATIVSIPAFEEASIVLVPGHALVASAWGVKLANGGVLTASAAGHAPLKPPMNWFFSEEPDEPTPLTVTEDGQVFGHLALWNQCHVAYASCELAPRSRTDYAYFHTGQIVTEEGETVDVGRITVGLEGDAQGGHASVVLGRKGAMEHYDKTGCVGAFVRAENGKLGIWLSGAVRSDAPDERIRDMRANVPSGDWRDEELVAVLSVTAGGFPIPRTQALIASAENGEEVVQALIASGYTADEAQIVDLPTYKRRMSELKDRRAALRG